MSDLTPELQLKILRSARLKVVAGHHVGNCFVSPDKKAANPTNGYCLRGALDKAVQEAGLNASEAFRLSSWPKELGIKGVKNPCEFSDVYKKKGCLRVLDEAIARLAA